LLHEKAEERDVVGFRLLARKISVKQFDKLMPFRDAKAFSL
jgi:hypothetical protein